MKWIGSLVFMVVMLFSSITLAENCQDEKIRSLIKNLDKTKIASVLKLSKEIKDYSKGREFECIEPLVVEFMRFYGQSLADFSNAHEVWKLPHKPNKKKDDIILKIKKVGWEIRESEGYDYIAEQGGWISNEFRQILNSSWTEYFAIRDMEIKEGFSEDASLMISWKKLCDRIIKWDEFMAKYPEFPLIRWIQYYHTIYARTFLTGMDNSSISDWSDNKLLPEVKKEYERFIKVNTKSKYHQLFKDYYELLSKNKFIFDKKIYSFLKNANLKSMAAVQPPTY